MRYRWEVIKGEREWKRQRRGGVQLIDELTRYDTSRELQQIGDGGATRHCINSCGGAVSAE